MPFHYRSAWTREADDIFNVRRSPAILCTNRQIYNEASTLFYSELNVHLQPGDVVWTGVGKDIVKPQWAFKALDDRMHLRLSGSTPHLKPEVDTGMGPHMLARFKNITFETHFLWEIMALDHFQDQLSLPNNIALVKNAVDQIASGSMVNTIRTVDLEEYAGRNTAFYRYSKFIHLIVEILSQSSSIIRLNMLFDVRVLRLYEYFLNWKSGRRGTGESVMVSFLESGVLTPLQQLSNVQSIRFRFASEHADGRSCELDCSHHGVLVDLKQKIERNHAVRNAL